MNAAEVSDQHVININPDIIVTGEREGDRLLVISWRHAARCLLEAGRHMHPEIMIDDRVRRIHLWVDKDLLSRVEREELSMRRCTFCLDTALIIKCKEFPARIKCSEILLAVVIKIPIRMLLQQPADIQISFLATTGVVVKKIAQRFTFQDCILFQHRITIVANGRSNNPRHWPRAVCPGIDIACRKSVFYGSLVSF